MFWLVYVSDVLATADFELAALVSQSRARNAVLAITGALIFTGYRFAQYIEGPDAAVVLLMKSIVADNRHENVTVIASGAIEQRRFADWTLAYAGRSVFFEREVDRMLVRQGASAPAVAQNIITLMKEFSLH